MKTFSEGHIKLKLASYSMYPAYQHRVQFNEHCIALTKQRTCCSILNFKVRNDFIVRNVTKHLFRRG